MKTKELIRLLQKADPTGEEECCIDNADISAVYPEQAYYDGLLEVLERNEKGRIVSGKFVGSGTKILIRPHSIHNAIENNSDFPVTYERCNDNQIERYKSHVAEWRKQTDRISNDIAREHFAGYIQNKASALEPSLHPRDINFWADEFFNKNMSYRDEMPEDIKQIKKFDEKRGYHYIPSWHDRRQIQWDREITVVVEVNANGGHELKIRKNNAT